MKKYFLFFILAIYCTGLKAQIQEQVIDPNAPELRLEADTFNFGIVKQGTRIEHDFKFINTGKSPLIITSHSTNCSCTDIYFPKEPIAPGKTGVLHFIFDTNGKMGTQDKRGFIESNNKYGTVVLWLKGNVIIPSPPPDPKAAVLTFDSTSYDFGKIKQGEFVNLVFHFTNTGKSPLIISEAMTSCGCDVAEYPKEPIKPGGSGIIKYELDTQGRMGRTDKTITVIYNYDQQIVLHVKGEIILPDNPK
jgi:hypothetical protein